MRKYELLCTIKPNLDMDEVGKVIKNLEESISNFGGKVIEVDKLGRKKLAYEINNFRDGFYVVIQMELPQDKIQDLKRYIKLSDNYLRNLITEASKVKAQAAK